MSDITLYGLKTCDTCQKAVKALDAAGKPATFVDVRAEADLTVKVPAWLEAVGPGLLNKASTTWRGLSEAEKAAALTDPTPVLTANPTLIKRPVIETSAGTYIGWTPKTRTALGMD